MWRSHRSSKKAGRNRNKEAQVISTEIITKNFSNLMKDTNPHVKEILRKCK